MAQPGVLNIIGGNDRGKRFELTLPETRIGRGTDQDVVLSDIAVSRRHFNILMDAGRYRVKDLGSGNGTLVNGQRVQNHLLNHGDHIEIGQTVMRFDQEGAVGVSKASPNMPTMSEARAPVLPPPSPAQMSAPTFSPTPAPPPPSMAARPTFQPSPGAFPIETPSDAVSMPTGMPARAAPYTGQTSGPSAFSLTTLLDTPLKQALVFGAMGLLCVVALITILARTVMAKAPTVPSEAEELYRQGLKEFGAGDYERAKVVFGEALKLAPDSPDVARYVSLSETEAHARAVIKNAQKMMAGRHYDEAVKALDTVDANSVSRDEAMKLRKEAAPRAAIEEVDEAKRLAADDVEGAKAKVQSALALDPSNEEARALSARLNKGGPVVVAVVKEPPAPVEKAPKEPRHSTAKKGGDDLAPVKVPPTKTAKVDRPEKPEKVDAPPTSTATGGGGALGGAALTAYKNKDFAGADRLTRMEALKQDPKTSAKTLETANAVRSLKTLLDKAAAEEASKPDAAIKDYNDALGLDAKLGKGANAAFLKQKIGKVEVTSAQAAFTAGKYDVAYATVTSAQRHGAGDGGLGKQLEAKAAELVQKGLTLQKSNLNQAKSQWRIVVHMVPTTSPNYAKAYQLLNAGGGQHKDEDEN